MTNFDDMALEELQQLLNVNTKNPNEVKRIQEMSGLTGKAVDGIWGKQTSKAWNNFLDENQSTIEQAIQDEQNFQNAMSRGQTSPAVVDVVGFANQLDEQQQARNLKIAKLESQIAQVEERIARNKRALYGKSYEDVNNKLSQLELDKIGFRFNGQPTNNDPTSFWRWNQARQDTKETYDKQNQNTFTKWANSANALLKQDINPYNFEDMRYQLKTIREMIANGQTIGVSDSQLVPLLEREKELDTKVKGVYESADRKKNRETKMGELDKRLSNKTIQPAEYNVEIQKLIEEAEKDDDMELVEKLRTKLQFGKKKATPSSVPQI